MGIRMISAAAAWGALASASLSGGCSEPVSAPEPSVIESSDLRSSGRLGSPAQVTHLSDGGCLLSAGVEHVGETITGTSDADTIDCSGASTGHTINAGGGDDIIIGSAFADIISGGGSNDEISGGGGDDILYGGVYDSPAASALGIYGRHDPSYLVMFGGKGGGGNKPKGGSGSDVIDGGEGNDTINGGSGEDILRGGPGNDYIYGGNHSDQLFGEDGDDILEGSHHGDSLDGGAGTDECDGGAGKDTIINCEG